MTFSINVERVSSVIPSSARGFESIRTAWVWCSSVAATRSWVSCASLKNCESSTSFKSAKRESSVELSSF